MKLSSKVMIGEILKLCLLVATLALGSASGDDACERRRSWWDRERGACIPCTRCEPQLAVKYPCELHRDTICQPIHEVNIWPFDTPKNNDSELSDYESEYYDDYADYGEVSDDGEVRWDAQTTTLTLAASGCVVFFVVVLYLSFYHSKQWKVLKQALRTDVQDLSAKLKLMEAGETPAEPVVPTDHHIYCNIHVAKDTLLGFEHLKLNVVESMTTTPLSILILCDQLGRRCTYTVWAQDACTQTLYDGPQSTKKGLGNVYTQEKHPS